MVEEEIMFSIKEKQYLSALIEKALLDLKHPEMPREKPVFTLKVEGAEEWSWAEIKPNWTFEGKTASKQNPWNEVAREVLPERDDYVDESDGPDKMEEGDK